MGGRYFTFQEVLNIREFHFVSAGEFTGNFTAPSLFKKVTGAGKYKRYGVTLESVSEVSKLAVSVLMVVSAASVLMLKGAAAPKAVISDLTD